MRNFLDDFVTWVRNSIYRVTKSDYDFFIFNTFTDVSFCFVWIVVTLLNHECNFVCTTMFWTTQRTNTTCNC